MTPKTLIRQFLLPKPTRFFFIRLALLAASAWWFFSAICIPARVNGDSMLPVYRTGDILFCWTPAFRNRPPAPGDVVMISYHSQHVMLLKRVLAVAGDTVEFRNGTLFVNGRKTILGASGGQSDWERPPETVRKAHVFVAGDNRTMPMSEHLHGQVSLDDLAGKPLNLIP